MSKEDLEKEITLSAETEELLRQYLIDETNDPDVLVCIKENKEVAAKAQKEEEKKKKEAEKDAAKALKEEEKKKKEAEKAAAKALKEEEKKKKEAEKAAAKALKEEEKKKKEAEKAATKAQKEEERKKKKVASSDKMVIFCAKQEELIKTLTETFKRARNMRSRNLLLKALNNAKPGQPVQNMYISKFDKEMRIAGGRSPILKKFIQDCQEFSKL
jgi:flagellar biosynthesis GTPase FlhF